MINMINFKDVQIQTTSVCNSRCIMCPYKNSWMIKNPGYMPEQLYDKILRNISKEDPDFNGVISPYLMNDPFADKNIVRRIEKLYKMLHDPTVEVSTNCELLDSDKINALVNLFSQKKSKMVISHHGIDKESLEKNMKINYEKATKNALELIKKADGRFPIAIQDMAISQDRKYKIVQPRQIQRYWGKLFERNNIKWNNVWMSTLQFHNRAGNVELEGWDYDKIYREIGPGKPFDCYRAHNNYLHVLWNGDVVLCCMDYHRETVFGNLKKQTIEEVFNSDKYKNIFKQVQGDIESPDDFICKRCMSPGG